MAVVCFLRQPPGSLSVYFQGEWIYYVLEAAALGAILTRLGQPWWVTALMLACSCIQVHFLFRSSIYSWAPDIVGHLDYIRYLAEHFYVPPTPSGWHRQQPFLYYEFCAAAYNIALTLGMTDPWHAVRFASRLAYHGFALFSILLVDRFRFPALAKAAALALILLWPTACLLSARTNNDLGVMFFFMASIYCLQRWHESAERKSLGASAIYAGMAFLCKASGAAALLAVAVMAARAVMARRLHWRYFFHRAFMWPAMAALLCLAGYFGRIAHARFARDAPLFWFGNIHPGQVPYAPLTPYHLVYFNFAEFVRNPRYSTQMAADNVYTFWDFFLHTILYGTDMSGPNVLMSTVSALFLPVVLLALWQIFHCLARPGARVKYAVPLAGVFSLLLVLLAQRLAVPDMYLANGRYVHPIVTLAAILACARLAQAREEENTLLYALLAGLCFAFAGASTALTVYNYF